MKLRTTKYIFKEGLINAYRNKLMSLASISVVTASMIVLGLFLIISINLKYNIQKLEQQPQMQVYCDPELDDQQIRTIEQTIKSDARVKKYTYVSKKEAFEKMKEMLGEDQDVLEGLGDDFMPVSFIIELNNLKEAKDVVESFKLIEGVSSVRYSQERIDILIKIATWVQVGNIVLTIILLAVAMFIISNTIKLTVFARRKEINIMKYIGATDWFIRWPFIVEGVVIGLMGAAIGFLAVSIIYALFSSKISEGINIISLVSLRELQFVVIYTFALVGIGIGSLGSAVSIRKYLHV
ncbi:permease-like cell division protein FtsX [Acetivibrio clariflavus]|uniref:Cell division protein FtsX n=1 Tax=Acetivibrio clariflavus (strain DSM 19732 / NBRC 101661 / EBR45) TaxID=720554 RepID=G8LT15_ACECE|nr:permease-like cell division protein FtsX [Acetivibrio clariflavus]AEV67219.1 cell division protein [Acetivibrio clariflavus DSM 19732]